MENEYAEKGVSWEKRRDFTKQEQGNRKCKRTYAAFEGAHFLLLSHNIVKGYTSVTNVKKISNIKGRFTLHIPPHIKK